MIVVEGIESIGLSSLWILEPYIPGLLMELKRIGYVTARVRPRSIGGYDIIFIEPNVIAVKGSTYVIYDSARRTLRIESVNLDELLLVLNDIERILRDIGSDPVKGVLLYELNVKALASSDRLVLREVVRTNDLLGFDLLVLPISLVSASGDPNSTKWFQLDIRPLPTTWSNEKVRYEVVLIYRDEKERLLNVVKNVDNIIREVLKRFYTLLKGTT